MQLPDIGEFELVVDSVDSLRQLIAKFATQLDAADSTVNARRTTTAQVLFDLSIRSFIVWLEFCKPVEIHVWVWYS